MNALDENAKISSLTPEERSCAMKRAITMNTAHRSIASYYRETNHKYVIAYTGADCGGICNTTYYHTIEAAAANLAVGVGTIWLASLLGGPAGMAAGAISIAGAIGAYYIAEYYALQALGDCFLSCYNVE